MILLLLLLLQLLLPATVSSIIISPTGARPARGPAEIYDNMIECTIITITSHTFFHNVSYDIIWYTIIFHMTSYHAI